MNDPKWLKLIEAISMLPFPPQYIEKIVGVDEDKGADKVLETVDTPPYYGNWSPFYEEGLPLFFEIEWIKIIPRYAEHRGYLVSPKIHDETESLRHILLDHSIPHEVEHAPHVDL
jgi:hypothetical protein